MRDYSDITKAMEQIIYLYVKNEKLSRDYNTGFLLTQAEIHTIEDIGDHAGISVTQLSQMQHKTKGAASQMSYKLVGKGLVTKSVSERSDCEIALHLTELGQKAYDGHKKYHDFTNDEIFKKLRNMDDAAYFDLVETLQLFASYLEGRITE
jgi:DNA-binding MarR family transcriptional regulator